MSGSGFADGIEFEETFPDALPSAVAAVGRPTVASAPKRDATQAVFLERMRLDEEQRLALTERLQQMLTEWQARFEQRFELRFTELERTLTERFTHRENIERASVPDRSGEVRAPLRDPIATASSARDVGRILRDRVAGLTHTSAFAVALHDALRDEVVYRYRIASDDDLGGLLRRDTLDDGPLGASANSDGWTRAQRTVRLGQSNVTVHTAQHAIRAAGGTIGVVTLQSDGAAINDGTLAKIFELVAPSAPRLAALRDSGSLKGV